MEVVGYEGDESVSPFSRTLEEINREFVRFVFCSHKRFVYLQRNFSTLNEKAGAVGSTHSAEFKRSICESSVTFREHLWTLLDELNGFYCDVEHALNEVSEEDQDEGEQCLNCLAEVMEVADSTRTLWHFLEFMLLHPSHAVWLQTIDWLRERLTAASTVDLKAFSTTDSPEFLSDEGDGSMAGVGGMSGGDGSGFFWRTVFTLLSEGRLTEAWSVLKRHSEIAEALSAPATRHNPAEQLAEIFSSHPSVLLPLTDTDPELFNDPAFLRQHVAAWQAWTTRVRSLLSDNSSLVAGIPPLRHMLQFFMGDVDTLQPGGKTPGSWQEIALMRLMYSPFDNSHARLSRQDVSRVLTDAIAQSPAEDSYSKTYTDVVKSLLKHELGDFLKFCASSPPWEAPEAEEDGAQQLLHDLYVGVTLVNTMHVAALLSLSGDLSSAEGSTQSAFVEKSVVAGCTQLNRMNFPHEVFSQYLEVLCSPDACCSTLKFLLCPVVASSDNLSLGSLLPAASDSDAIHLSDALLTHGSPLMRESQSVLVTRGLFWLQRNNEAKALFLFIHAQAHSRAAALLDTSFQRCIVAFCKFTRTCSETDGVTTSSILTLDGLAIDYKCRSDIHSTTTGKYALCSASDDVMGGEDLNSVTIELIKEIGVAAELLGVISNHPQFPQLSSDVAASGREVSGVYWEDEVATGRTLSIYSRLLETLLQYSNTLQGIREETDVCPDSINEGLELLRNAAEEVKLFLVTQCGPEAPSASASSMEFMIPQRYWLHLIDVSVWISKQNTQLRTFMDPAVQPTGGIIKSRASLALFNKEEVGKLLRLLLHSQHSYVPNPLNETGMRPHGGLLSREFRQPGQAQGPLNEYGAELHTELLDMEVTALCLDNQQQFSAASPLGYYPSSGAPVVTSVAPSHYARPSARSSHTDAAIDRYLSAPVALQSWRREQLSQGS